MAIKNLRDQTVSNFLKSELKRLNMTASELAEKINAQGFKVGRATVYYYVSGVRLPSTEVAVAIGAALGTPLPAFEQRPVGRPIKPHVDVRQLIMPDIKFKKRPEITAQSADESRQSPLTLVGVVD